MTLEAAPLGACDASTSWLRVSCATVTICQTEHPDVCETLAPAGGPYPAVGEGMTSILVQSEGGVIRFDARVDATTLYDIDVVAYGSGGDQPDAGAGRSSAVAAGRASAVRFDGSALKIRLFPVDAWACADADSAVAERAFHQAVTVSNGDVLVIGGAKLATRSILAGSQAALELVDGASTVEVFDVSTESFVSAPITGDAGVVTRAFFDARWIERTADGRERVRLFGGYGAASTVASLTIAAGFGPVQIDAGAEEMPVVDILYDPTTHAIEVVEDAVSTDVNVIVAAAEEALPTVSHEEYSVLLGESDVGAGHDVVTELGRVPSSTFGGALAVTRRAPTLTHLDGNWLVYGGNVSADSTTLTATSAELFDSTGTAVAATLPPELAPSIFHTASTIGDRAVFVGGLALSGEAASPVLAAGVTPTVRVVERSGTTVSVVPVDGAPTDERAFHTATVDEDGRVLVIGGSTREGTTQLHDIATGFAIRAGSSTFTTEELPALVQSRFGHATALLFGGRVLVTGGLLRDPDPSRPQSLTMASSPELLVIRDIASAVSCTSAPSDAGASSSRDASATDAGVSTDAASTDASSDVDASS